MTGIKAIIFDWGGVLIDEPLDEMLSFCAKSLGVDKKNLEKIYYKSLKDDFARGKITEPKFWKIVCDKLKVPLPEEVSLWTDSFKNAYKEKEDVLFLARELKDKGYKIGLLSNTELPIVDFFYERDYGLFDAEVFSCIEGFLKPEKEIYIRILKKLDVKPEEALFIDDKIENVEGAVKIGMQGAVFNNFEELKNDLRELGLVESDEEIGQLTEES